MLIVSKLNYLRISPRKVRLVADLIRKQRVEQAERILNFIVKKAARPLIKLLKTAVADARNNFHIDESNGLYISKIIVNEGPKYKRWRPRSRGMANQIKKRTSQITLVLETVKAKKEIKTAKTGKGQVSEQKVSFIEKTKVKQKKKILRKEKGTPAKKEITSNQVGIKSKQLSPSRVLKSKIREGKQRSEIETSKPKPKIKRGLIKRIFRRKSF